MDHTNPDYTLMNGGMVLAVGRRRASETPLNNTSDSIKTFVNSR